MPVPGLLDGTIPPQPPEYDSLPGRNFPNDFVFFANYKRSALDERHARESCSLSLPYSCALVALLWLLGRWFLSLSISFSWHHSR